HRLAADRADAPDQAVGRRALDQLLAGAPLLLSGEHERAVLDEAADVQEVVEVLARGAPALGVAPAHGLGPAVVAADLVALVNLGEVLALALCLGFVGRGVG